MGQFTFSGGGGGGGGGAVSSVFTRTGAVVALTGDYTASQVTNVPAGNIGAVTVQAAVNELDTEKAGLALANIFTAVQTINLNSSALPAPLGGTIVHVGAADAAVNRHMMDVFGTTPVITMRRANGTNAAKSAILLNDVLCLLNAVGYGATGYSAAARGAIQISASENWTDTAQGTRIQLSTSANGSATNTTRFIVENDGSLIYSGGTLTGLHTVNAVGYYATNLLFVDANAIFRPRSYTIGTLPTVTATGIIHCSDLGGGPGLLQSDGTGWNRVKEEGTITIATDAGHTFTWDRLVDAPVTRGNATLTANRTATLSATGCRNGDRAMFVRLGGGAFNWSIAGGTTFALTAADQFCEFEFDGTTWNLIAAGRISVASGGGGVDVEDEGVVVLAGATTLNFTGAGVTATNAGGGQVDVTIPGGGGGGGLTIGQYIGLRNSNYF